MTRSNTHTSTIRKERKRIGRLKTAQDVARFMAKCIKEAARGEGAGTKQYNMVNMASQLLKAIEVSELEGRISNLEGELRVKQ